MSNLNLGILAHVDAGKTSLTERILYETGVIDALGSVDAGSTQTDSLELERQRGITIKAAATSFMIRDLTVNLLDTPGHPDFIAEVERVLGVLDGAVLVISAVEGIQAQTRLLMRALGRLAIPTLIFVNKIDRTGAQGLSLVDRLAADLSLDAIAMGVPSELGSRSAAFVAYDSDNPGFVDRLTELTTAHDDSLPGEFVTDRAKVTYERLRSALGTQTANAVVHPVYFGSAITGAGLPQLLSGIKELLPPAPADESAPASGSVFKVERSHAGQKLAFVRMFSGTLQLRDRVRLSSGVEDLVTGIEVFDGRPAAKSASVKAGQIGKLSGLTHVRIGDHLGQEPEHRPRMRHFALPTLQTVIVPRYESDKARLHSALTQLAEQDPLIALRQDDVRQELYVSLYGEVQKEVIRDTLARDFGIDAEFRKTSPICIERVSHSASAIEELGEDGNPFLATVGLRLEPGGPGTGTVVRLEVKVESIPRYVYKSVQEFHSAMTATVAATLCQGLYGWEVPDCIVTLTDCNYSSPGTNAGDFRKLTPLVLMTALRRAGTIVCEPVDCFRLEIPEDTFSVVLRALARLNALSEAPTTQGRSLLVEGQIAATRVHDLRLRLPELTHGEGLLETELASYRPVHGRYPTRRHTGPNPLERSEYLKHLRAG
ncbi:MAG: GTP-binding protein [Acidimicrobiales bacterium]